MIETGWHHTCPNCGTSHVAEWDLIGVLLVCGSDHPHLYRVPGPAEQPSSYVDTHEWPRQMEDAVIRLKGDACTVPGCDRPFETLDHRVPWSGGGPTSVENLYPMCDLHNREKGDQDYAAWLANRRVHAY